MYVINNTLMNELDVTSLSDRGKADIFRDIFANIFAIFGNI